MAETADSRKRRLDVFTTFLRLGCTSFGGPVAHLGYFRTEFVEKRRWFSDATYADLVALCQFLPGPASSQVGMAIGLSRAGYAGMVLAWIGFTLPSAVIMLLAAWGVASFTGDGSADWLKGLKLVAVAVVAQAVFAMARTLCPDRPRATLGLLACAILLAVANPWMQIAVIILGGLAGLWLFSDNVSEGDATTLGISVPRTAAIAALAIFAGLLLLLPLLRFLTESHLVALLDTFYRAGSLVFGGGHVILPLLQAGTVDTGWLNEAQFLAGYGAAQAIPGPLFTFAGYLGAIAQPSPNGLVGGVVALVAVFGSSFLLVLGALPFWDSLRRNQRARAALTGVNASVVGLLGAALYDPVWTAAVHAPIHVAFVLVAFLLLELWKVPPWLVVIIGAIAGIGLELAGQS